MPESFEEYMATMIELNKEIRDTLKQLLVKANDLKDAIDYLHSNSIRIKKY